MKSPPPSVKEPFPMNDVIEVVEQYFERDRFDYNLADSDSDLPDWVMDRDSPESSDSDDESTDSDLERAAKRILRRSRIKKKHKYDAYSDEDEVIRVSKHSKTSSKKGHSKEEKHKDQKDSHVKIVKPVKGKNASPNQGDVEQLIKQLGRLSLNDPAYGLVYYKAIKLDPKVAQCISPPRLQGSSMVKSSNGVGRTTVTNSSNTGNTQVQSNSRPAMICYGCGKAGHGLQNCEQVLEMVRTGALARDDYGRITFSDGTIVRRLPGESIVQAVSRSHSAEVHFIEALAYADYYQSDSDEPGIEVFAVEKEPKMINKARKEVFDGVGVPRASYRRDKENISPTHPVTSVSHTKLSGT